MAHIVLAPHLDDEVIGCYSVWDKINKVVYFTKDYRESEVLLSKKNNTPGILEHIDYISSDYFDFTSITDEDTIYIPSKYDFHPLHKVVRNMALGLKGQKMFYSVEMNVPWLEEENDSQGKLSLLKLMFPKEDLFIHNAKYYLFKSIKPFDDIVYRKFRLGYPDNYVTLYVQQFTDKDNLNKVHNLSQELTEEALRYKEFELLDLFYSLQNEIPNRLIKLKYKNKIIE